MQNTNLPWRIYKTTDKYFNYGKKGYRFCEIGLMLYSLSEHQIEALSNLLRGNGCFISQPTRSGKSAVVITPRTFNAFYIFTIKFSKSPPRNFQTFQSGLYISLYIFLSLLYEAFQLLRSNDVYVVPKIQEIVICNM
jgi:hypothetical protein